MRPFLLLGWGGSGRGLSSWCANMTLVPPASLADSKNGARVFNSLRTLVRKSSWVVWVSAFQTRVARQEEGSSLSSFSTAFHFTQIQVLL